MVLLSLFAFALLGVLCYYFHVFMIKSGHVITKLEIKLKRVGQVFVEFFFSFSRCVVC